MFSLAVNTTAPIFALVGLGWLSRRLGWLQAGDERVLNSYVYYFAIPALFIADLSGMRFDGQTVRFIAAGILPLLAVILLLTMARGIWGFSQDVWDLLVLSTAFGSLAFFGIPYINFAFPGDGGRLATLSAVGISVVGVSICLVVLEWRRARTAARDAAEAAGAAPALWTVAGRLARNPLVLSAAAGTLIGALRIPLPVAVLRPLHMLGGTTITVAIFLLGVFLYGRRCTRLGLAFRLSLLRMVLLPCLALPACWILGVGGLEKTVLVLQHAMPLAIAMIVLSERYDFERETVASLVLVSSVGSAVYLNVWLWLLGP